MRTETTRTAPSVDLAIAARLQSIRKIFLRPGFLLVALLAVHLCTRLALHRSSPLSGAHNYDRSYGVSLSLLAGRGFHDIVLDESAASAPVQEFLDLKRSRISREEFAAYLASNPDPARDPFYGRFFPLASIRVADIRIAAVLWRIFGIDRGVLAAFYSLFSMATCACLFFIARRLTGSGWAGLAAAALLTISPIEGFLNTWSWRDVSPMWFTAAALAWFVCGIECWRRPAANIAAYGLLGVLAVVGIGWRIDALLLAPFLAACVVIPLISARSGWRYSALALSCFAAAGLATKATIASLGADHVLTANIGYHMAFYSDFPRSKLLGVENSFEVLFSDMQTLDYARQIDRAEHPDREPVRYLSAEYCDLCRSMLLEELNYNLFHWISGFPSFYRQALAGLDSESVMGEVGSRQIQDGAPASLRRCLRWGDQLGHAMPFLFLAGILATACVGRRRLPASLLALFSVYYAGIMFLVLPDQKHIGVLLVPLYVFAGAGIWAIPRLFAPATWSAASRSQWRPQIRRAAVGALIGTAIWGLSCAWARAHSVQRRQELLDEVERRAALRDRRARNTPRRPQFHGRHAPDSPAEASGYLLKISAGQQPGMLICRQIYFPRDWAHLWGRALITRHKLIPNREQSFFVSCLQGSRLGDPCPHLCTVAIEGDARIQRSTRVAMNDWSHPQLCTLFYDRQQSPGSPNGDSKSTEWLYIGARPFGDPSPDRVQENRSGMIDIMAPVPAPSSAGRPLCHMIGRYADSGTWKIAMSDGWRFSFMDLSYWSPTRRWLQLQSGDFNGDGMTDIIGQAADGQWWLASANGGYFEIRPIDSLPRDTRFDFVAVGDFNGDGLDDLALRSTDGNWTLALSNGTGFNCRPIDFPPSPAAGQDQSILIGDFLGNGGGQVAAFDPQSGHWTLGELRLNNWIVRPWGSFPAGVRWQHTIAGDFRGTGHVDVAAWDAKSGVWMVGHAEGGRLAAKPFGKWASEKNWKCVRTGQFGDGRHAGIAAVDRATGEICVAFSDGRQFILRRFPGRPAFAERFFVGDFSGRDRDELLGVAADGQLWVGRFEGGDWSASELKFQSWGRWPNPGQLGDFQTAGFWPTPHTSPKR